METFIFLVSIKDNGSAIRSTSPGFRVVVPKVRKNVKSEWAVPDCL